MPRRVTARDVIWGYAASILNIGSGIILLPAIVHYLTAEDVGLWFVFVTLGSLAQLLEMGFQPTLARNTAYVFSGAQSLKKEGLPPKLNKAGEINQEILLTLVESSERIYQFVALTAAILLFIGGSIYVESVTSPAQDSGSAITAWLLFSSGYIINFYFGYINGILQGKGKISEANKLVVITKTAMVIFSALALALGFGLIGLATASLLSAIGGRVVARWYFLPIRAALGSHLLGRDIKASRRELVKVLWHNASRGGAVQLGAFLIQRGSILIASSYLGLAAAASYSMTVTILMAVSGVAMVFCQVQVPHLSGLQAMKSRHSLAETYGSILLLCWATFVTGTLATWYFGPLLFNAIGSDTKLLAPDLLMLLGIVLFMEFNHSIAAIYLSTTNRIPYLNASLLSGAGICIGSIFAVQYFSLVGLILTQGLIQILYNNWKWPLEAARHLGMSYRKLVVLGAKRILLYGK